MPERRRENSRHHQIHDCDGQPDFQGLEITGHDLLPLPGQLANTDNNKQGRIFQADDKLVADNCC